MHHDLMFNGFIVEKSSISERDRQMVVSLISVNLFGTKKFRKEDDEELLLRAPQHMMHQC